MMSGLDFTLGDNKDNTLIYKAKVVSVPETTTGFEPIQCRLQVVDHELRDDGDLTICYPLLPKHLNVYPKVNEYVYIVNLAKGKNQQIRYFIGPVVDTFQELDLSPEDRGEINAGIESNLRTPPEEGIYPKREWISIQGRKNADLTFKDQEVLLRAGRYKAGNPLIFNNVDTAYVQMRYGEPKTKQTERIIQVADVKLFEPDGFVFPTIVLAANATYANQVNIRVENKDRNFIGKIYQAFITKDEAISFIKTSLLKLKRDNDPETKSLITDGFGTKSALDYDFTKFKYSAPSIPELEIWAEGLNPGKETVYRTEKQTVTETFFDESKGSAINIVSDKINILSYANKNNFKLLDPLQTITPEEQIKINTEAQPIPYGYILLQFLELIKTYALTHRHNYNSPPDLDVITTKIKDFPLETMLNLNVRTA